MPTLKTKKILFAYLLTAIATFTFFHRAAAQAGAVYTVAGGGSSSANGVPATSAVIYTATGIGMDATGNFYYADMGLNVVRKIDGGSGLVYTVAGMAGMVGHTGDGGPATAAELSSNIRGIHVTASGDIFISDASYIRKVDAVTGIITTIAGGGASTADGVPATSAVIYANTVYADMAGNVYFGTDNKIKRVDAATGMITTIAGNGIFGDGGDGGAATLATIDGSAKSICMDNAGNLYIISFSGNRIRKINAATGIITTVAGGGTSLAEGIPATSASFADFHNCRVDGDGNIFIADWSRYLVRRVDAATGIVNTIAGIGTMPGGSSADGTPALSADVRPYMILVNPVSGNIYYSDFSAKIKRLTYTPLAPLTGSSGAYATDSQAASIYKQCSGPQLTIRTPSYHPGMEVRTYFGDGFADTSTINTAWSGIGGFAIANHVYATPGTYTIKHVLCNAGVAVDTLSYSYDHVFCATMAVKFYNDIDHNCTKGSTEPFLTQQVVSEVDSNSVPIDTVVATSGFNYLAYGAPGDIYRFKVLSHPAALYASCPTTGTIYDTLHAGITTNTPHFMGLSCASATNADLEATAYVPVSGPNDQWGHIYIRNNYCIPADASVTLNFSPKYAYTGIAVAMTHPAAASSTATSITWNLSALSNMEAAPQDIYYVVVHNPAVPYPVDGELVNEHIAAVSTAATPDIDLTNNTVIRTDTVNTSCDPNAMEVSPSCFDRDTTLHFTVHFENIGSGPAVNIYVMDTLSPFLDPSTFSIEMSSHPMFVTKLQADNRTIFRFDFPNINLSDSSDHLHRDGMLMYTVKNIPSMANGWQSHNQVGIYFDYNDVLMTNTATATRGCPVSASVGNIEAPTFALYPNPASDELTIKSQPGKYTWLTITNTMGQQVWQQGMPEPQLTVSLQHLPAGLYFVVLHGADGSNTAKFVKL